MTPHSRALLEHRDELLAEAKRCGLTNVRVFGSIARGDADENSDIDLLVSYVPESRAGFHAFGFAGYAQELLGLKVDVAFEGGLDNSLLSKEQVLSDAIPL